MYMYASEKNDACIVDFELWRDSLEHDMNGLKQCNKEQISIRLF